MYFSYLFFGGYVSHIVLAGKMGLDDSEARATHSFAHSFSKVAEPCSTLSALAGSLLTKACWILLLLLHSLAKLEMINHNSNSSDDSKSYH